MPDVIGRDELERRLARVVSAEQRKQLNALLELLGDPPDPARVPPDFWANGGASLRSAVEPVLRDVYLGQAQALLAEISIGVDWALVNQAAVTWARQYTFDLVKGITETNQQLLQTALGDYFRNPVTIAELESKLVGAFGPVRAEMISVTEITRAAAEGEQAVIDRLIGDNPGIEAIDVWQTNRDDRVCIICGPRHNKPRGPIWQDNPPAHPRCRCWLKRDFRRSNA
jgi:hypothetical protein